MSQHRLTYRNYRDSNKADITLLKSSVRNVVNFAPLTKGNDILINIPQRNGDVRWLGIKSNSVWTTPPQLSAYLTEPILVINSTTAPAASFVDKDLSSSLPPKVVDQVLLVPGSSQIGLDNMLTIRATPGLFSTFTIPPGYTNLLDLYVNGVIFDGHVDYDPYHGVVYLLDPDGLVVDSSSSVDLVVNEATSWRVDLTKLNAGTHVVTSTGVNTEGLPLASLTVQRIVEWNDVRKLPVPTEATARHATDYGYFDGGPIADSNLWIIETEASAELVEEAVKHTMPLGTMYRIERP